MRHKHSEYMHWAKTQSRAPYNLATSGVGHCPMSEVPFDFTKFEINGDNLYGYSPLKRAIAEKYGADPECVVESAGTSMANHLAMAAILERGDEVLIEHPAYGPLLDAAMYLEAEVRRFPRTPESGFAVDPEAVRAAMTPRTRLIVITNLHNPSSALTPEPVLREIGEMAASVGAHVLVDEVYLDVVYEDRPRSAFFLGPQFLVTSSLTKVYGLSGLRCGWIVANPDLARRMQRLNNIYAATPAHPTELLSVAAFQHLDKIRDRARRVVETDRAVLRAFLDGQTAVRAVWNPWGSTAFLKLEGGCVDAFLGRLREQWQTSAVPGKFFETPDHFRVGMGVNSEIFAEGLRRAGEALAAV